MLRKNRKLAYIAVVAALFLFGFFIRQTKKTANPKGIVGQEVKGLPQAPSRVKVKQEFRHKAHTCQSCQPKEGAGLTGVENLFKDKEVVIMPSEFSDKSARKGDIVNFRIGPQVYEVTLTTAGYRDGNYLFEGIIGEDGKFYLSHFDGKRRGILAPSLQETMAFEINEADDTEWLKAPLSDLICLSTVSGGHDEIVPIEYDAKPVPVEQQVIPLHESLPTATAVIYLDFDDHALDENLNPVPGPKPLNRHVTTEQMTYMWEIVSEHLIFYDLNVTTDESVYLNAPGNQRARIIFRHAGGGGASYLDIIRDPNDGYFTFVNGALSGRTLVDIAGTAIHEVGHTLGVNHDTANIPGHKAYYSGHGTGRQHWSPIMGRGYSRRLRQWSKGEYNKAQNFEDDLQVMQSIGRFTYRNDDHSNLADASATDIAMTENQEWDGIIEREGDVDTFAIDITESGILEIEVCTKVLGMLNVTADLVDASGVSQDSSAIGAPVDSLDGQLRCYVEAGTYYLKVGAEGDPNGLYTAYSCLGSYKVDYSFTPGLHQTYNLTATAENGSIDFNGTNTVFSGDDREVFISGDNGYKITTLNIAGQDIPLTEEERNIGYAYTLTDIQADQEIVATFEATADESYIPPAEHPSWTFFNFSVDETKASHGATSIKLAPRPNNLKSEMSVTEEFEAGTVSFFYKVSSHDGTFDFFVDGQKVYTHRGYQDKWTSFSYDLPAGVHTLTWRIRAIGGWGQRFPELGEAVWIDQLELPIPPKIEVVDWAINDSLGDGNAVFNPGETLTVSFALKNTGANPVEDLSFSFSEDVEGITLENNTFFIDSLAARATSAPFSFNIVIGEEVSPETVFDLSLVSSDLNGRSWPFTAEVLVDITRYIRGTITGYEGQPAAGVSVSYNGLSSGTVIADAAGAYEIEVANGEYILNAEGERHHPSSALTVVVQGDQVFDFQLQRFCLVNATTSKYGRITPRGVSKVNYGDDISFDLFPRSTHEVRAILLDGVEVSATNPFVLSNVTEDHEVRPLYQKKVVNPDPPEEPEDPEEPQFIPVTLKVFNPNGSERENVNMAFFAGFLFHRSYQDIFRIDRIVVNGTETAGFPGVLSVAGHRSYFLAEINSPTNIEVYLKHAPFMEHGETKVTEEWKKVHTAGAYNSMVVVATPVYEDANTPPVAVRIRNVQRESFEIKLQHQSGETSPIELPVKFIAVEEGRYWPEGYGIQMEAYKVNSAVTDYAGSYVGQQVSYQNVYESPVVLGQVMTANDDFWSTFWSSGEKTAQAPDSSFLRIGKQVGEDTIQERADETVGYVVIEAGNAAARGYTSVSAGVGEDIVRGVDHGAYSYNVTPGINAMVCQTGMDGTADGGFAVFMGDSDAADGLIQLSINEDRHTDPERFHVTEQVAWLTFNSQPDNASCTDDIFRGTSGENISGDVARNDSLNGFQVDYVIANPPSSGTVVMNTDGTFTYSDGTAVEDSFTYNLVREDGRVLNTATVTIKTP